MKRKKKNMPKKRSNLKRRHKNKFGSIREIEKYIKSLEDEKIVFDVYAAYGPTGPRCTTITAVPTN